MTSVGQTVVSARSRSGRRWRVDHYDPIAEVFTLVPLGPDVRPAQDAHGRFSGGVRRIRVESVDLNDARRGQRA